MHYKRISFALLVSLGSPAAHAWPLGRMLHLHPGRSVSHNVSFELFNGSQVVQSIAVGDQSISLQPKSGLRIKAPEGAEVVRHNPLTPDGKEEVLFAVQSMLSHDTVVIH